MKPPLLGHISPFGKFIFVILLVISSALIFTLAGILLVIPLFNVNLLDNVTTLTDYQNPQALSILKFLQIMQSTGIFIVPAILSGIFFQRNASAYLGFSKSFSFLVILMAILVIFVSLPVINWMISVNEMMTLPESLQGIEQWMKDNEDQLAKLSDAFLNVNTVSGFCLNILMIAVIPAFGEEMLFRGVLQRLFSEWFRNIHVAVFFTAFLFGAIHMQFYGILPRFAMGVIFGYLFYWSGSLWLPVICHFLYNGFAVVVSFLSNRGFIHLDYEDFGATDDVFLISGSVVLTGLLMLGIYYRRTKSQPLGSEQ